MKNKMLLILLVLLTGCHVHNGETNSNESSLLNSNNTISSELLSSSCDVDSSSINGESSSSTSTSESSSSVALPNIIKEKEALDMLKNSPFSNYVNTEESLGLYEMYNVGVNKDRFDNEILYEVPEDGIVYIKLLGACSHCSMIDITLKDGIEEALINEIPEVKSVQRVD